MHYSQLVYASCSLEKPILSSLVFLMSMMHNEIVNEAKVLFERCQSAPFSYFGIFPLYFIVLYAYMVNGNNHY